MSLWQRALTGAAMFFPLISGRLVRGADELAEGLIKGAAKDSDELADAGEALLKKADEVGDAAEGAGAKNLVGKDFEDYLTQQFGGDGSFSKSGRDFDGGAGNRWWEAKSGQYWKMLENDPNQLAKFKSDMGHRLKIARENGSTYELFSNTPIPQTIKDWLNKKGIPFTELFD